MNGQVDYIPPPVVPTPPPAIHRPYQGDVGGLIPQNFTPSNQLIAQMPPFLRQFFANKKIQRPSALQVGGNEDIGAYGDGIVQVARTAPNENVVTRHELLHALSAEHPRYRHDPYFGYGDLRRAVGDGSGLPDWMRQQMARGDWAHNFVHLGEMAMDQPDALPIPLQNYFAPLLPPVQRQSGPR